MPSRTYWGLEESCINRSVDAREGQLCFGPAPCYFFGP
jgi:hypothetical protein